MLSKQKSSYGGSPAGRQKHWCKSLKKSIILGLALAFLGMLFLFPKVAYPSSVDAKGLIKLTNIEREKEGLPALLYNEVLALAAKNKALDLLREDYFSHSSPKGKVFSDWVEEAGYNYSYTGENLAMDFMTNEGVMNGWFNSGKHKENILNDDYQEIGMATIEGQFKGRKTVIVVQIFGAPAKKMVEGGKNYLALSNAFLLPRFLDANTYDIFIPKSSEKTFVKHNEVKKVAVLNSGHLKTYRAYNDTYWGEVDAKEFSFRKVRITLLGQDEKKMNFYPF